MNLKIENKIFIRLIIYIIIWQLYLIFMSKFAPLGVEWRPFHFQRIVNISEFLQLNGYWSNFGFSIFSKCEDCSLELENWENKIYISATFFPYLPYILINNFFGSETLKLYGSIIDKTIILMTGILISELFIKLTKKNYQNFYKGLIIFVFFTVNPWTYKMLLVHWNIVFFLFFFLCGVATFKLKYTKIGLLFFFISGIFNYESAMGIATFYFLTLIFLYLKSKKNFNKNYFSNLSDEKFTNFKVMIFLLLPVILYLALRFIAIQKFGTTTGSDILTRIGISGNDTYNGGILGALQFLSGNRITKCIADINIISNTIDLYSSMFLYNCLLTLISMFLISVISIYGLFISFNENRFFYKSIIFPLGFLLLSFIFILQQSSSVHIQGYSYIFSLLFSFGVATILFKILEKYNYSVTVIILSLPISLGVIILCIRVSMITGLNG